MAEKRRLTTQQVAARLGVKPETVYAYVSRGLLGSRRGPGGRASTFDPDDVERLARRRRGEPGGPVPRAQDAAGPVYSSVTLIEGDAYHYRGVDAIALARRYGFEEVAWWLWTGSLVPGITFAAPDGALAAARAAGAALPPQAGLVDRLRVAAVAAATMDPVRFDLRPRTVAATARGLIATFVDSLPRDDPRTIGAGAYDRGFSRPDGGSLGHRGGTGNAGAAARADADAVNEGAAGGADAGGGTEQAGANTPSAGPAGASGAGAAGMGGADAGGGTEQAGANTPSAGPAGASDAGAAGMGGADAGGGTEQAGANTPSAGPAGASDAGAAGMGGADAGGGTEQAGANTPSAGPAGANARSAGPGASGAGAAGASGAGAAGATSRTTLGTERCTPLTSDSIAARLWPRLTARPADADTVAILDTALVLLADHGLAASTVTARTAASARAHPYAVVSAALGTLEGPLHGAASGLAHRMLTDVLERGAGPVVAEHLRAGRRLPGLGHRLYRETDPRAQVLFGLLAAVPEAAPALAAAHAVTETAATHLPLPANIDLALATLSVATGMPPEAGETIFAVARTAGWIAHALEEYDERALRVRVTGRYEGPPPPQPLPEPSAG